MNFFRRQAPPTVKEAPSDPSLAAARLEKERRWMSTVSGTRGGEDPSTSRSREYSSIANGSQRTAKEGGGEGKLFGKWLNSTSPVGGRPNSSQASIESKKSFFRSGKPDSASTATPRSQPSSSTSPSPTLNLTSSFSPPFSPASTASTEPEPTRPNATVETKTLASRLQELATANADGLLDDDEYRLLRHQVFETHSARAQSKMAIDTSVNKLSEGTIAVPRLNGNASIAGTRGLLRSNDGSSGLTTPPTQHTDTLASPVSSPLRTPSILSHQSNKRRSILPPLDSLFRRETSSPAPIDVEWDVVTPPSSSPNDHFRSSSPLPPSADTLSILSDRSSRPNYAHASTLSPPTSPVRNRSIRNHPGLASSALDSRSSTYFAGSSRSSNGGRSIGASEGVLSAGAGGGGGARRYGQTPRSPTSTRTRSYYGGGGGGPSSSFSHGYSSSHSQDRGGGPGSGVETPLSSLPPISSSTDPLLFAATGREPTVAELEREIGEIQDEWERMRQSWSEIVKKRVETWEKEVGPTVAGEARLLAKREKREEKGQNGSAGIGGKKGMFSKRTSIFSQPAPPPSATLDTRPSQTALTFSSSDLPQCLLSSTIPLPSEFESKLPQHVLDSTLLLRSSMEEILDRRRKTDEKYQRRLEFLWAKEKGAKIKQGLLK